MHAPYLDDVVQAMSIKFNNLVYEKRRAGEDVIVLSLGEAFFDIPLFPFDDLPFPDIYHYSHSRGIYELRDLLSSYYRDEYGVPTDPDTEIIVTAGSKVALHMAFMVILEPGDEVLIPEPAWVSYSEQVKLCHGEPVFIPWDRTVEDYASYVTERTRAIVINSPHNPRGKVYDAEEWRTLHELADTHELFIISDEAYSDFLLDRDEFVSAGRHDGEKRHTIVCNSMSKNYGMSGWRIGYVIGHQDIIFQILKVNQHLITCPATILEWYLAKHFHEILEITYPQIREVVEKRERVGRLMDSLDMSYLPGNATFYFFVSLQGAEIDSETFATELLEESNVCVVPGIGYGPSCDGFIRLSVGTESWDRTERGVRAIAKLVRKYGG